MTATVGHAIEFMTVEMNVSQSKRASCKLGTRLFDILGLHIMTIAYSALQVRRLTYKIKDSARKFGH